MADQHAREPAREYTEPLGLTIFDAPAGQAGKVETHLFAKKMLAEAHVTIPPGKLPAQLKAITAAQTPGGGLSITSPRRAGSHGDLASSWILALWAAAHDVSSDDMGVIACGVSERGRSAELSPTHCRPAGERIRRLPGGGVEFY